MLRLDSGRHLDWVSAFSCPRDLAAPETGLFPLILGWLFINPHSTHRAFPGFASRVNERYGLISSIILK
jgi:hypothetical protein